MNSNLYKSKFWPVFILLYSNLLYGQVGDLGHTSGVQYHPFLEWSVSNINFNGNPFDVESTVIFTHTNGKQDTTSMFYAQGSTWSFRFSGSLIGDWSFITYSNNLELDGHFGTVNITENSDSNIRGFLRGDQKWYWEDNMQAVIPNYVMYYEDVTNYLNNPSQIQTT